MPHNYSTALKNHLKGSRITVAVRALITRSDGHSLGLTSHVRPVTIGGVLHHATPGLITSALVSRADGGVDNASLGGFLTPDVLEEADLRGGAYDDAACLFEIFNYADLSMGTGFLGKGYLGNVTVKSDGSFGVEFRSLEQMLSSEIGQTTSVRCRNRGLGRGTCPVDLSGVDDHGHPVTTYGTVTGVDDAFSGHFEFNAPPGLPTNFYRYGRVKWTSGLNSGFSGEVYASAASGSISSWQPFPFPVQVGDSFEAVRGCDLSFKMCCDDFSTHQSSRLFNGEPWVQGEELYRIRQD